MQTENWSQGNWNAHVVFECSIEESRERCRQVPNQFKQIAMSHASTYWKVQGHKPPPRKRAFAGMTDPHRDYPLITIEPKHWELGCSHLANANWQHMDKFGDQELGFAAEYAVTDYFDEKGIEHNHNPNPRNTNPDFTIAGNTIDLKTRQSVTPVYDYYDGNLADRQRLADQKKGTPDWYFFGYWNNTTPGDLYLMGFQTLDVILDKGVFYREGEITRGKMEAPRDVWCIEYKLLVKTADWLEKFR